MNLLVRASGRIFHALQSIIVSRSRESGALCPFCISPRFVPFERQEVLRHFVSREFKNEENSTLNNYLDEKRYHSV